MGRAIMLKRGRDGSVSIRGDWPELQTLPVSFIGRELGTGLVGLRLTIGTDGDPVTYEVTGFGVHEGEVDGDGNPKPNYTEWLCKRVESGDDRG